MKKRTRNILAAFAVFAGTGTVVAQQESGTKETPRIVGPGITFAPGDPERAPVASPPENQIPTPPARPEPAETTDAPKSAAPTPAEPAETDFGKDFLLSLPQKNCSRTDLSTPPLEEIENILCIHTKPAETALDDLIDHFHKTGETSGQDFQAFKNAYIAFLDGYGEDISPSKRLELARGVAGNLFVLVGNNETWPAAMWKTPTQSWMNTLYEVQYPPRPQPQPQSRRPVHRDNSREITGEVYNGLQAYARSGNYIRLQRSLYENGLYYREDNQQVEAFMDIIKSGRYDYNFRAQVNLSVCAAYAMVNLSYNLRLNNEFSRLAGTTVSLMDAATDGQAGRTNCRSVFFRYRLN